MARLGSFDVAGRVDNTSMLVGTEIHKKVASAKNYKINAVRRFMLEGLAPETGGLLKYHEIGYDGDAYSTPYDFVNDIEEDIDILRYHILVVRINEDKFLFTRQGVSIGTNSEAVEEEDFIALNGISAGTIRQLILDLESRTNLTISELEAAINLTINELESNTNAQIANLHQILDETSLNQSDSILGERNSRIAAVNVLSEAITTEAQVRAALTTSLSVSIADEISNRTADITILNEALADESTARATLATTLNAAIEDEVSTREAAVATLNESIVDEFTARAALGTTLTAAIGTETANRQAAVTTLQQADTTEAQTRAALGTTLTAAIGTETTNRQAAITTLNTAIANETTARTTAVTNLTASINTEKTNREAAVTTLQQADTTEAATRAQLGTTLTAAINTEKTSREAAVTSLTTAITNEASTRATAITGLTTTITNNYNTLSSSITTEADARTTAVQSVANSVNSLTTTVNGHTSSITTNQTAIANVDGKLSASYGLSVDANGRIASMKLLSSGASSEVVFNADKFKIYNGASSIAPFVVENNQVRMTNVSVDSLVTPGTSGLSLNINSDNLLQFRHPNGVVGMKMGIVGGVLTLNWYDAAGNLIWQGGAAGVKAVDNTVAAYSGQITNLGYFVLGTINTGTVYSSISIPTANSGDIVSVVGNYYKAEYSNTDPPGLLAEASAAFTVTFSNPHSDGKYRPNIFIEIGGGKYKQITEFTKVSNNSFSFSVNQLTIANAGWVVTGAKVRFEIVKTLF